MGSGTELAKLVDKEDGVAPTVHPITEGIEDIQVRKFARIGSVHDDGMLGPLSDLRQVPKPSSYGTGDLLDRRIGLSIRNNDLPSAVVNRQKVECGGSLTGPRLPR